MNASISGRLAPTAACVPSQMMGRRSSFGSRASRSRSSASERASASTLSSLYRVLRVDSSDRAPPGSAAAIRPSSSRLGGWFQMWRSSSVSCESHAFALRQDVQVG